MKKKILVLGVAVLLSFSMTACGGGNNSNSDTEKESANESTETAKEPVALVESGYHLSIYDSDSYLKYGATLKNPNKNYALEFPKVLVTAKDKKGAIIATDEHVLNFIAPGDTVSFGSQVDCKGKKPDSVEITAESGDYISPEGENIIPTSNFKISNTSEIKGDGEYSYTGEVTNTSKRDISSVAVTVILKNKNKIVYGTTTYIDDVKAGSKKAFDISEYNLPKHNKYIITARSWE